MSRRPIPAEAFEHGDPKRYRRGCRCRPCVKGITAEVRRRRYLRNTLTTPTRAASHIHRLRAAGMPDRDIRAAANIADDILYRILRGEREIRRATEQRILSVAPPQERASGCGANVPGLGTIRRLRAHAADGWTAAALAQRVGKHKQFIVYLQNSGLDSQVRLWVADYTRSLSAQLEGLTPEGAGIAPHIAGRTRTLAAKKGWVGTAYWDEDDFDNPDFVPAASDKLPRIRLAALRRAEIAHLASFGVSEKEIATRLGMDDAYVHDLIRDMDKRFPAEAAA
ncbi:hypothetical protein [Streptomyces sp. NPDC002540]